MQADRSTELRQLLAQRLLILDGAMGTMVQRHGLVEADYRGARLASHDKDLKGNNDLLCLTRPDVIGGIHAEYLAAGDDIIETNSFNATRVSQAEYGLADLAFEVMLETGVLIEAIPFWEDEWAHAEQFSNPSLIENIQCEGIRL